MAIHDSVKEDVELREDVVLAAIAGKRAKNFDKDTAQSHEEIWSQLTAIE